MLGTKKHLDLPRRVVVYYLLFCLVPLAWMTVRTVQVSTAVLKSQHEQELLAMLRPFATEVTRELAGDNAKRLQVLLDRMCREKSWQYVAVVNEAGDFLAHTYRGRVGKRYERPVGETLDWGEFSATRFGTGAQRTREYTAPLRIQDQPRGRLLVAVAEPNLWSSVGLVAAHTPLTLLGPLVLICVGAVVMNGMIRPLAAVESQLRQTAVAASLDDARLQPVRTQTPAAIGWNRLVGEFQNVHKAGDIDKRLSEAVQSRRAEKSDEILNSIPEGLAVTDQEGCITFANQTLSALMGPVTAADSLRGKSIEDLLELANASNNPDSNPLVDPALRGRPVSAEIQRVQGSVEKIWRVARAPIRGNDRGVKGGHVWMVRDITQQKLAEQSRDQFLSSAAHEIRTPLANIKAYAETLSLADEIDLEHQKEFMNIINSEVTRLARFIDDLLSISSMEAGALGIDRQECDLDRMFREIAGKVKGQLDQKQIEFTTVFPEKWPQLRLDKDKFTVAIVNLLSNAAKYTPERGRVALKVKVTSSELRVEIEDTGIGISAEELPRVFDKFFRSQSQEVQQIVGTGIGLSMAQEVIRLHGGDLTVRSELGQGTTFTATLPLKA